MRRSTLLLLFLSLLASGAVLPPGKPELVIADHIDRRQPTHLVGSTKLLITGLEPGTLYEIGIAATDGTVLVSDQLISDHRGRLDPDT